jgi:large subunit ribosomal protein L4e
MMNREMARISRLHGKVGYLAIRARVVPQAVKGRQAHPPKAEKIWAQKINQKENALAIKSALAASSNTKLVKQRHKIGPIDLPIIVVDDFENLKKTREVSAFLDKILKEEMKRCSEKKIRPGKGKTRNRKYRKKKGPLVIASKECPLLKSARNIPGIDAVAAGDINIGFLAPGAQAGRLTITTKAALDELDKNLK